MKQTIFSKMNKTPIQVLKESGKKPQTKSYMWVRASPTKAGPIVLFDYDPTRSGEVPKRLMQEFKGKLQGDG